MPQTQEDRDVQEVVRAHAGWVFACAKRRVRDDALADDVAQAAFILFWQKGASLEVGGEVKVTGWLYRAVRYCAGNALRLKQIRQRHEREAAMAALADGSAGEVEVEAEVEWSQVSPELEWAVDRLRDEDRSAVLLRFYRQMSFSEVGQALGISEEAAKKRVQRALEKLRGVLAKKGVVAGAAALGVILAEKVTAAAPAGLVEAATAAAGGGGTGSAGVVAKGAMKMMAWAKVKVAALIGVILVAGGAASIVAQTSTTQADRPGRPPAGATSNAADGRSRLNAAYGLVDGEVVKRIEPPFIPSRMSYWNATDPRRREPPDQIVFAWSAGEFTHTSAGWGKVDPLANVIQAVMNWTTRDFLGPADMLTTAVPGDWVVRAGATEQEKLAGLLAILQRDVDPAITIQKRPIEREVIVAKGTFRYAPHPDARGADQVIFYSDPYVAEDGGGWGTGTLAALLTTLGNCAGEQVVDEVERTGPKTVSWRTLASCWLSRQPTDAARATRLDSLLKNVAAQTGLTLTREKRKVSVWVVDRKKTAQSPPPAQGDGR